MVLVDAGQQDEAAMGGRGRRLNQCQGGDIIVTARFVDIRRWRATRDEVGKQDGRVVGHEAL